MNQRQNNKLNMYTRVNGVLNENKQVYEPYAPIVDAATTFISLVGEIRTYDKEQSIDYTGITDEKSRIKEAMAQEASDLAFAGISYARATNNVELAAHFDYSFSDIRYTTNNNAMVVTELILNEVDANIEPLGEYLVSPEDADSLRNKLQRFKQLGDTGADKSTEGVATTKKLSELFEETDRLLKTRLDALVTRLRHKEPMFYDAYMNARQIIDLRGRRSVDEDEAEM